MHIIYRILEPDEWDKLTPLYSQLFPEVRLPGPETAMAYVAESEGKIVAFWFLQVCAHMEPVGIDPQYAQEVSLHKLRDGIHEAFSHCPGMEYYIYTANPDWDKALQVAGFRPIGLAYAATIPDGVEGVNGSSSSSDSGDSRRR